jgi:hypothetical protein
MNPAAWLRDNERHLGFHPPECCQQNLWPDVARFLQKTPVFSLKAHFVTEGSSTIAVPHSLSYPAVAARRIFVTADLQVAHDRLSLLSR